MKLVDVESQMFADAFVSFSKRLSLEGFCYMQDIFDDFVDSLPVSYDIDKVTDLLIDNAKTLCTKSYPHQYFRGIGTRNAISIIRSGGLHPPT